MLGIAGVTVTFWFEGYEADPRTPSGPVMLTYVVNAGRVTSWFARAPLNRPYASPALSCATSLAASWTNVFAYVGVLAACIADATLLTNWPGRREGQDARDRAG